MTPNPQGDGVAVETDARAEVDTDRRRVPWPRFLLRAGLALLLVLDAQAVIAAPPDLYLVPGGHGAVEGEPPR